MAAAAVAAVPAQAGAAPPLGRAYELISPVDDPSGSPAGVATDANAMPGFAAQDGNAVVYGAPGPIGSAINGAPNPLIFGTRDPDKGWNAETVTRTGDGGESGLNFSSGEPINATVSPDASSVVFGITERLIPGAVGGGIYRVDRGVPAPTWLSSPLLPVTPAAGVLAGVISTPDLSTVAFRSTVPLTSAAPGPPADGSLYVSRNGQVELASILPDGSPAQTPRIANMIGSLAGTANDLPALRNKNALTRDGRYLLFRDENVGSDYSLYVRDLDAGVTRPLAVLPAGAARLDDSYGPVGNLTSIVPRAGIHQSLAVVADDAPVAFFRGTRTITTPSRDRLYEANLATGNVQLREAITGPPVGLSPDGSKALFVKFPVGGSDPFEIRLWDRDSPSTSVLLGNVPQTSNSNSAGGIIRFVRSVNDGDTWVFAASGTLDPTRPNLKAASLQVYRWNVGDAHPTCLSCQPTDSTARLLGVNMGVSETGVSESVRKPAGTATLGSIRWIASATPSRSATDDGRIIAFDSPDRLTSEDQNNVRDVYLWDADAPAGQELQLVTSGQGTVPSFFLDMDADGRNVFFTTQDGLVPADRDGAYDVYVARVGGGFPEVPDLSCAGEDDCRFPTIEAPKLKTPGSDVLTPPTSGGQQAVQSGTPKLRVKSLRTSSRWVQVRVDAPGAGRIRVTGSRVKTTNRSTKRATTYSLRVPLTAAARKSVDRGKRVKVSLRVQFTPSGSSKSERVSSSVSVRKGR